MAPTGSTDIRVDSNANTDRRENFHLQLIFKKFLPDNSAIFDPEHRWGAAHLTLYAQQFLREAYPELSLQDIAILFSGVQSFHIANMNKNRDGI